MKNAWNWLFADMAVFLLCYIAAVAWPNPFVIAAAICTNGLYKWVDGFRRGSR